MNSAFHEINLGKSNISILPMGVGTWQWGDRMLWGFGRNYNAEDARAAFEVSISTGLNFFDTAEIYGLGQSERFIGEFLMETPQKEVVIATKFFPYPWRLTKNGFKRALRGSLRRLGLEQVDLYQIHWPFGLVSIETWANALADAMDNGLVKSVGVSNYDINQMRRTYEILAKRGVVLASNQVEYSLLDRKIEFNGLMKTCQELGVSLIAYSPLAKGMLTGKYTPTNLPPGQRSQRYNGVLLEKIQPLLRLMRKIGNEHGEKTEAQVALNWLICKGAIPIPGAKNERQAQDNAGALTWRLREEQVAALDEASNSLTAES